jgi:polyisoprenyl-phosphate glycosyltransferase
MPTEAASSSGLTFIIPVYNEENAVAKTARRLNDVLSTLSIPFEIIIVDDGSTDGTGNKADQVDNVTVLRHPANSGYGRALKTGISHAQYDWIGIVDADGTYEIEKIPELVEAMEQGFDMAVALRKNVLDHDGLLKKLSRKLYVSTIQLLAGRNAPDPNSGLRIFTRDLVMTFLPFLCNTFSFTTSLTVFALGGAWFIKYVPSHYEVREGRSKVRHFRDTLRTIQLIVQGVTFFNPVKFYLLLALSHAIIVGVPGTLLYYGYPILALPYLIAGTTAWLLVGMGALGDIFRVALLRSESLTKHNDTPQILRLRDP